MCQNAPTVSPPQSPHNEHPPAPRGSLPELTRRNGINMSGLRLTDKTELKKTGTTNTKGISWCSHSGVMLLHPGLYHFQQISGRCFLQLLGQCLRLPIKEHVSFRLVGAIKVCVGGVLLLYYTEVCWKHSTHECFWRSFISSQMCFFFNWKSYVFKGYTFNLSPSKHAGTSWNWKSIYILTIKWN